MATWKQNLLFVWLSQFLSIAGFSLALPFAPYYIQTLGITEPSAVKFWAALATSCPAISLAIASPVWGMLADKYGRKLMMLRANFSAVLVLISMAFAPNVHVFVILRLMQGFCTGTMNAAMTFVAASAPQNKQGMALGSLSAAVFSGAMFGPFMGGFLAEWVGYRPTFVVSGALLFVSALLILIRVQEKFVRPSENIKRQKVTWRVRIAALGPGAPILILLLFMSAARRFDQPILPLYVQEIHGQLAGASRWTGALNGVAAIGAMLAGVFLGRLADRVPPPMIGKLSAISAGFFMTTMGLFPSFLYIFPARFLFAFSAGGLDPVFQVWLSRVTPESRRGTIFGWSVTAKSIGWAISPLISGIIAVRFGLRFVYFAGPFLFCLLIPLIHIVSRKLLSSLENVGANSGVSDYAKLQK